MATFVLAEVDKKELVTSYKINYCHECQKHKRMSQDTFLCKRCFNSHAADLRKKYGRNSNNDDEIYHKWREIAEENGICKQTFDSRINKSKMTFEQAATTKLRQTRKAKRVTQYDLEGNIIKSYRSLTLASTETGISRGAISAVCNGKRKTANGYVWKFEEVGKCVNINANRAENL